MVFPIFKKTIVLGNSPPVEGWRSRGGQVQKAIIIKWEGEAGVIIGFPLR
jgi:hypothetical protein